MKTVQRLVAALFVLFVSGVLATAPAAACSCADLDRAEQFDSADVVARVIVERTVLSKDLSGEESVTLTMRPTHVWKGDIDSRFRLVTALHVESCGLGAIPEGRDMLVFAGERDGTFSAGWCGGSSGASDKNVDELVAIAGPGVAIGPLPIDVVGSSVWQAIVAVAALVVAVGVFHRLWVVPRPRR